MIGETAPRSPPGYCQPAATGIMEEDENWNEVTQEEEYIEAVERPCRKRPEIDKCEGMSYATQLQGHDTYTLFMKSVDQWKTNFPRGKGPANLVSIEIMTIFNEAKKRLEALWKSQEKTPMLGSLPPSKRHRQPTRNWAPAKWNPDGSSEFSNQVEEVKRYLKEHEGEARIWQVAPEKWLPLKKRCSASGDEAQPAATRLSQRRLREHSHLTDTDMGVQYPGTQIGTTLNDRAREFKDSRSGFQSHRRVVKEFGLYEKVDKFGDNQPDCNSALSTLVVRGKHGQVVTHWIRQVRVITLPEVLLNWQHEVSFETMYKAWEEGACVIRAHPPRGEAGRGNRMSFSSGVRSEIQMGKRQRSRY